MITLNSLIVPKYLKGETLWHFSLPQNIKKTRRWDPLKAKKFRIVSKKIEKGDPSVSFAFAHARKYFWLKQGFEPVTTGFTVNRVKSVLKNGLWSDEKKEKKTSHCNSQALFTRKAPNKS